MNNQTQQRLLDLNRVFYKAVADEFDSTRLYIPPGMSKALEFLPALPDDQPLTVLDIGCGNGRFAWALNTLSRPIDYTGIDANLRLLQHAQTHVATLPHIHSQFFAIDLVSPNWILNFQLSTLNSQFSILSCFATLHHFPGFALRQRLVQDFASLLRPTGKILLSNWQALTSSRFVEKTVDWATIGIDPSDLERGDVLLPWNQGVHAVRYVHQIDQDEIQQLAAGAGLQVEAMYRIDGKEGNLNLYAVLQQVK